MAAYEVTIDSESRAKVREPDSVLMLTIFTLGIYNWCWYYRINCEMRDYGRAHGDELLASSRPGRSLLAVTLGIFAVVPPFVSWCCCARRLERMQIISRAAQEDARRPTSFSLIMAFMFAGIVLVPLWLVNPFLVQNALIEVWEDRPTIAEGLGVDAVSGGHSADSDSLHPNSR